MNKTGTLGALLQGVSQQPQALRQEGKVTRQFNMVSDVVRGLTSRPALTAIARVSGEISTMQFVDIQLFGVTYIVGYAPGKLRVWGVDGTEFTVATMTAAAQAYLSYNMLAYVFDDKVYITDRDRITAVRSIIAAQTVLNNSGVVYCLGGQYTTKYNVQVRYPDGVVVTGSYTTPDGSIAGDAAKTSSSYIIDQLRTSLVAKPALHASTIVVTDGAHMSIRDTAKFTVTTDDAADGATLRSHVDTASSLADLAAFAPHGTFVRITGSDAGTEDDYYLRFNSEITDTLGEGFGSPGVWEEWVNTTEVTQFDQDTMPFVLSKTDTGFAFKAGSWTARRTGDTTTNPFPDFIGHPIRDICGFQQRLVFAAGPWCCMSQSKEPTDFFKKSALTELATDPIGVSSTKSASVSLDWIIPFDEDLVFLSDPGAGQFIISGAGALTSGNASIVQTTAFEMNSGTRPAQTGRTILFPFRSGKYTGINEFYTNSDVTTNSADNLTETLDRYIVGQVNRMECSTNRNTVLLKTDISRNTVYVYQYLWKGTDKLQSAWSQWLFYNEVRAFFFDGSAVYFVLYDVLLDDYLFQVMDLDREVDPVCDFHVCLDGRTDEIVQVGGTVTLDYPNASFAQSTGCLAIGSDAFPDTTTAVGDTFVYTFNPDHVPTGVTLIAGHKFQRSVDPTMPFLRDYQGEIASRAQLTVTDFYIEYTDVGALSATMTSKYRDPYTLAVNWFPLEGDLDITDAGIRSGILSMPWGERADWSELSVHSDDIRPTTIPEIEWEGQPYKL